jgi:hypothetical protein
MKALLVVGLLLCVSFPVNEATGQTAACRDALAAYRRAADAFLHATVVLGPANLVPTCTALAALLKARKRKDITQRRARSACPAGTVRTDDPRQWKQFLEVEKTRIDLNCPRKRGRSKACCAPGWFAISGRYWWAIDGHGAEGRRYANCTNSPYYASQAPQLAGSRQGRGHPLS